MSPIISDARHAGLADWDGIEKRGRPVHQRSHWDNPGNILKSAAASFNVDKWTGQPYQLKVWIEKEVLIGMIDHVCERWNVSSLTKINGWIRAGHG